MTERKITILAMRRSAKRLSLADSDLVSYSKEHLLYEIKMFLRTGELLCKIPDPLILEQEIINKNALLESFITHFRNLILFLYPKSPKAEDIISDYFFVDPVPDWRRKRPKESSALRDARTRSHKEISHLTVGRLPVSQGWPVRKLVNEIKAVLQIFVNQASSSRLDPSVKEFVATVDSSTFPQPVTDPSSRGV